MIYTPLKIIRPYIIESIQPFSMFILLLLLCSLLLILMFIRENLLENSESFGFKDINVVQKLISPLFRVGSFVRKSSIFFQNTDVV